MASKFREAMKSALGGEQVDVELIDNNKTNDDYGQIMKRVTRIIGTYMPCEHILHSAVPANGNGPIDVAGYNFKAVNDVYVIKDKNTTGAIPLPWTLFTLTGSIWVSSDDRFGTDFLATDMLLYNSAIKSYNEVAGTVFSWKFYNNKVYVNNVPDFATGIGIQGLAGVSSLDDIPDDLIEYELALKLAVALAKQKIGTFMRKFTVEGLDMPGQEYVSEGKEEENEAMAMIEENAYYPGGLSQ